MSQIKHDEKIKLKNSKIRSNSINVQDELSNSKLLKKSYIYQQLKDYLVESFKINGKRVSISKNNFPA